MKIIFDDYYASICGNVFSKKNGIFLKPYKNKRGYLSVKLSIKGKAKTYLLHRLIAKAFYGDSNLTVDHINNIKSDNRPENLRYISALENHRKAILDNSIKCGCGHYKSKLSSNQIKEIRISNLSQKELSKKYGVDQSSISRIKSGKSYAKNG